MSHIIHIYTQQIHDNYYSVTVLEQAICHIIHTYIQHIHNKYYQVNCVGTSYEPHITHIHTTNT